MSAELPRGTVTFLFSDIQGSTELSRRHGAAYGDMRAEHRRLLREVFSANAGFVVDTEGDAFFVAFERATDAVKAAVAAQRALATNDRLRVRIGLHTTEPHLHSDGYVGVGVSRAARICAAAHGGQIVLSHATAGVVEDESLAGLALRDLGEHHLKDIPHDQRLFQVEAEGLESNFPPLVATATAGSVRTLVITDLDGWTQVMRSLGDDAAAAAANAYHQIVDEHARANGGRQVERGGDHSLSVFESPYDAIVAAAAIDASLRDSDWIDSRAGRPALKAAIHTGTLPRRVEGYYGSTAFRAARLCGAAESGQILVSHATHALLEGQLLGDFALRDLGERALTTAEAPARVYELVEKPPPA